MEFFPGDWPQDVMATIGTTADDLRAQQLAGHDYHQLLIDEMAANQKYVWQAMQAANNVGGNTNNNSNGVGGDFFDAAYCSRWMVQRCDTDWMRLRASAVQFDAAHTNVSIASFLIARESLTRLPQTCTPLRTL